MIPSSADDVDYPGLPPSSPEAAAYAARAIELGRASAHDPIATAAYGDDPSQRIEVYVPRIAAAQPLPVLLFLHGGAWVSGGLQWLRFMAPAVTAVPAVFVACSYRLAPTWRWPAACDDACAALALTSRRSAEWGGDAQRLILSGHSAGGHLASLAVLKQRATPVRACFPVSTSFDLRYGDVPDTSAEGRVYRYLLERREQDAEASPVLHVKDNRVPFHVSWGERDFARIVRASEAMVQALRSEGARVSSFVGEGCGHFDMHLGLADPKHPWYDRLREEWGNG